MAMITADQINYSDSNDFSVGFFSLKNDGEEAIVRIMCDSMSDLEIMTVHPITVGASSFPNRQVNCIRDPRDPLEMCPLCASGEKVKQKIFIKMLQYDPVTKEPKPVIWDRVASVFAPRIKSFLDNYGPLSHIMCKIIRHGTGKSTVYDIVPNINPQEYNEVNYPILNDAFKDFTVLGRMVMDKNADEIMYFMRTGSFPDNKSNGSQQNGSYVNNQQTYTQPQTNFPPDDLPPQFYGNQPQATEFNQPSINSYDDNHTTTGLDRPVRHY